jgi:ATP-dependent DNA helicase RecG
VVPTAFASSDPLDVDEVVVRLPRVEPLREPLVVKPAVAAEAAEALGLRTVEDLLLHLPRESGEARTISELRPDETSTVLVEVRSIVSRTTYSRRMRGLAEAVVSDETGVMKATFFNQPWLDKHYRPGTRLMLTGRRGSRDTFKVSNHAVTREIAGAGGVATYPATKGLNSTRIAALVQEHRDAIAGLPDPLPGRLRAAEGLPDRPGAVAAAHFGDREAGRARLAFDELLLDQIVQLRLRDERRAAQRAAALADPPALTATWLADQLPFTPTGDQDRAMVEIDADLARDKPMQRLLMGEVGSGKTVVALHTMLRAVEHGMQAALMAPTETLAEQHFATVQALMPGAAVPAALLTGSTTATRRADILGKLATGELGLVVGTHALIEDPVVFDRLAVVVVDEQHRFGVRQRAALDAKAPDGLVPHVLHMTATPIPRTLRLASFGALDVTVLRELPKGRQPIETHVAGGERERERAYQRIREELVKGRQAFVVCPLVAESEALAARAATAEYERLRTTEFRDFEVVLLHGQMKPRDKAGAMERFASGAADVLVATTVIEVGIDVPNATVMLVEDAERYGISQLHQLRGRVGRGADKSLCLLFGPKESRRLKALETNADGFALAEIDLELRGEGEITGTRQSGLARFRFARLPDDAPLLERARARAEALLADALRGVEAEPVAA